MKQESRDQIKQGVLRGKSIQTFLHHSLSCWGYPLLSCTLAHEGYFSSESLLPSHNIPLSSLDLYRVLKSLCSRRGLIQNICITPSLFFQCLGNQFLAGHAISEHGSCLYSLVGFSTSTTVLLFLSHSRTSMLSKVRDSSHGCNRIPTLKIFCTF